MMMYRSLFPRDVFAELDRLQREMQQSFDLSPSRIVAMSFCEPRS